MLRAQIFLPIAAGTTAVLGSVAAFQYDLPALLESASVRAAPQQLVSTQTPAALRAGSDLVRDTARQMAPAAQSGVWAFDIVRINPDGVSVLAGRAAPNASVTVLANGQPVATTKADGNGEWSLVTEHKFAGGRTELSIAVGGDAAAGAMPSQVVTVDIPVGARPAVATATTTSRTTFAAVGAPASPVGAAARPQQQMADFEKMVKAAKSGDVTAPPATVPIPITFVFREAQFTEEGRRAASLLGEYLKAKRLDMITLSGHADERGSAALNMELSRQRLDMVARHLREAGFDGRLVLLPKGKSEPYFGANRQGMSQEQAWQLDRRVELRTK